MAGKAGPIDGCTEDRIHTPHPRVKKAATASGDIHVHEAKSVI